MQAKRLIVLVGALIVGIAFTALIIYGNIPLPLTIPGLNITHIGFNTTPEKFAYSNVLLLVLSVGGIAFIWLDYFLDTQFLKR
jgi:hypothetical protein